MGLRSRLLLLTCLVASSPADCTFLVKDVQNLRAVQYMEHPERSCFTYGHPLTVQKLQENRSVEVRNVSHRHLRQAIDQCHRQLPLGAKSNEFDFIYPGTRWCGPGDVAFHYDDLGFHTEVDACCRAHDFCSDIIPPKTCKYGLCNTSPFTASHCDCDEQFRSCLANLPSSVSYAVGLLFFDVGALPCFRPMNAAHIDRCPGTPSESETRNKRHCSSADGSGVTWEFVPAKSFKASPEQSRSFGRSVPGGAEHVLSQVLGKIGDVTTIVKSVVSSTLQSRRVGHK